MTKEQREEYAKIHAESNALIALAAKGNRLMTGEEKTVQDARYARMDVLKEQYEAEQKAAAYAFKQGEPFMGFAAGGSEAQREAARQPDYVDEDGTPRELKPMTDEQKFKYRQAANRFLRTGEVDKFAITTTGNAILVPTAVAPPEAIRRNYNAFRALIGATGYQPIATTGTETFVLPIFDDTGVTGDTPAQNATTANTADFATTGSVSLGATLFSSKQRWFSNTMLNANGFDILAYVTPIVQKSVDKIQESAWTTTLQNANTSGSTTTASTNLATGVIYTDLLTWEHNLNIAYRSDAGFIVSDSLYKNLRGLTDNNKRPIFDLDPTNVFQGRIHGKPVFVSDYLSTASAVSGISGVFISGDAIKLRDVVPQRLTRYVNVPQYPDQTGFQLYANGDCQFVINGVAHLRNAAS